MHPLAILLTFFFMHADSGETLEPTSANVPSSLHTLVSAYGTMGGYSTGTDSRSMSSFVTLSNAWRDYYTVGYANLWLSRDDAGGKYYSQILVTARASWLLSGDRISLAAHYGYLDEGAIQNFSTAQIFHWAGAGGTYWFSPLQSASVSFSLSLGDGKFVAGAYRGIYSFHIVNGIWATSTAILTDANFSPRLFSLRQSISVPLGNDGFLTGSGELGRRGFYFDDETLVVYNQRSVQTGSFMLKGIIQTLNGVYLIPSFEYNVFDEYNVKYGSLGIRIVF